MNRLLIYFAYDAEGILNDYIFYAMEHLKPFVSKTISVINGKLETKSREKIEQCADEVIVRPNEGFDVWAYKTAIDHVGWDGLMEYDEMILMNHTIMGPVYDLTHMFETMSKRKLDFWGITKCFEVNEPSVVKMWNNPYGFIPEHIQSSFMVFRRSLISSEPFQTLWNKMPKIKSYYESGGSYEQVITKKFADLGFKWDCYTDYSDLDQDIYTSCPLITAPLVVVRDLKSPFFKRRTFFTSKSEFPATLPTVRQFWSFLETTGYDRKLVLDNLIRTCNQRDIAESLLMMRVIIPNSQANCEKDPSCRKAIFVNTENLLDEKRLRSMLEQYESDYDIFFNDMLSTDTKSLFTGVKASYLDYDYILCIAPPENGNKEDKRRFAAHQEYYIYNMIQDRYVVDEMIRIMQDQPLIGMISYPPDYLQTANWEHYENWADYCKLFDHWMNTNRIHVSTDIDKPPLVGIGGCAVIRRQAIENLYRLRYGLYGAGFTWYCLAILCQANGYMPIHALPVQEVIHNCFGYETSTTWQKEMAKVKRQYYEQQMKYNQEQEMYYQNLSKAYAEQVESYKMLEEQQKLLRQQYAEKDAYCQSLTEAYQQLAKESRKPINPNSRPSGRSHLAAILNKIRMRH